MNKRYIAIKTHNAQYGETKEGFHPKALDYNYDIYTLKLKKGDSINLIHTFMSTRTFYVPSLDISICTNRKWFEDNFELQPINYNKYWAKLNQS